jgi:hypothetical protein
LYYAKQEAFFPAIIMEAIKTIKVKYLGITTAEIHFSAGWPVRLHAGAYIRKLGRIERA